MPLPRAETTPPVTKMKRVSGWRWESASSSGKSSVLTRAAAGDSRRGQQVLRRVGARPRRRASAPSMRHSSSTTPSPSIASTVVSAVSVVGGLLDPEVRAGERGDLRQVGDAEHLAAVAERSQPLADGARRSGRRPPRRPRRTRACATRPRPRPSSAPASPARARRPRRRRAPARPERLGSGPAGTRLARHRGPDLVARLERDLEGGALHRQRGELGEHVLGQLRRGLRRDACRCARRARRARRAPRRARPRRARSPPRPARGASRSARQRSACASTASTLPPCLRSSRSYSSRRSSSCSSRPGSASSALGVAAQLRAQVLGLEPQRGEPLGQRVELGVGAADALGQPLGLGRAAAARRASPAPARSPRRRRRRPPAARRARAAARARPAASACPRRSGRAPRSPRSRTPAGRGRGRACRPVRAARPARARAAHLSVLGRQPLAQRRCSRPQKPSSSSSCAEASVRRRCSCWPKKATIRPPSVCRSAAVAERPCTKARVRPSAPTRRASTISSGSSPMRSRRSASSGASSRPGGSSKTPST